MTFFCKELFTREEMEQAMARAAEAGHSPDWASLAQRIHEAVPQTAAPVIEVQLTSDGEPVGDPIVIDRTPAILARMGLLVRNPED